MPVYYPPNAEPESSDPEIDPEQLAQWETAANEMAEERAKKRLAMNRYLFLQGLATGIAGTVIIMVIVWSLWF